MIAARKAVHTSNELEKKSWQSLENKQYLQLV